MSPSPSAPRGTLVVAGLHARLMVESAVRAGWDVVAMDAFGDRDTRALAREWHGISSASTMTIDEGALERALSRAAHIPGVLGWVAGNGFEERSALLDVARDALHRLGMTSDEVRAVRDPQHWFATLRSLGLEHPMVVFDVDDLDDVDDVSGADARGDWLVKDPGGRGGWHIRSWQAGQTLAGNEYLQRRVDGASMSALFLADGKRAHVVGLNHQDIRPARPYPYAYHGSRGPVQDTALQGRVQRALDGLTPALSLRGLASIDFLVDARQRLWWLELNPRPSATMTLHDDAWPRGLMHAHVEACAGRLPSPGTGAGVDTLRGHFIVYAPRAVAVDSALSRALAARADCHDLPMPGTSIGAGEPLCSVTARVSARLEGADVVLQQRLARSAHEVLELAGLGASASALTVVPSSIPPLATQA
jgi:uncharacterized protein